MQPASAFASWPVPVDDLDLGGPARIPVVSPGELSADAVRRAIASRGSAYVPGLISPTWVQRFVDGIEHVLAVREANKDKPYKTHSSWFRGLPLPRDEAISLARPWVAGDGGMLACDSPRLLDMVFAAYEEVGLKQVLTDYLGERPILSGNKATLRRARLEGKTDWHQDGAFLGSNAGIRALNVWVALTDCGVDAPGMDIVPRRFESVQETGTGGAIFDWAVGTGHGGRPVGRRAGGAPRVQGGRRHALRRHAPAPHRARSVDDPHAPCHRVVVLRRDRLPRWPGPDRLVTRSSQRARRWTMALVVVVALAGSAYLVAACGGDDDEPGAAPSTEVTTTTTATVDGPDVEPDYTGEGPTVAIVGDSLTASSRDALHEALEGHAVKIAAVRGEGLAGGPLSDTFGRGVMADAMASYSLDPPDVLVFALGTNDAWQADLTTEEFLAEWDRLIGLFPDTCLVGVTVTEDAPAADPAYDGDEAEAINDRIRAEVDVVVDWATVGDDDRYTDPSDTIHLTDEGRARRADLIAEGVADCLAGS